MLGVAPSTIFRWLRQGLLQGTKIGRTIFVPASEVRRLSGVPIPQPAMDFKMRAAGDN